MDNKIKDYFHSSMGTLEEVTTQTLKQIHFDLYQCRRRVSQQIRLGRVQVSDDPTDLEELFKQKHSKQDIEIISKRLLIQREIDDMRKQDFPDQQSYHLAKKELITKKQELLLEQKKEEDEKQKQVGTKVKKWANENKQLMQKRQIQIEEIERKKLEEEEIEKKRQLEEKIKGQIEKKKAIEHKLREIQENRMKREQFFRNVKSQSVDRLPYYVEAERKYQTLLEQKKFEEEISKKNKKYSMKMDYEAIKAHQRKFIERMQQRQTHFQEGEQKALSASARTPFSIYLNRSDQKFMEQKQKRERRIKFQQKINEIPIEIDEAKKVKVEIAIDRSKNPFKYNFLSQKSLNEFQIYGEFKNFQMNLNPREHGLLYLQEIKKIVQESRIDINNTTPIIRNQSLSDRPQYRDYLKEIQVKKKKNAKQEEESNDEISKAIRKYKNKERAQIELSKKYSELDSIAEHKKSQIRKMQVYKDIVKKQAELDNAMNKAMKAKLALLEIKK